MRDSLQRYPGSLIAIETHLPDKILNNKQLADLNPLWEVDKATERTGVYSRRVAEKETSFDLGKEALRKLFERFPSLDKKTDGLIFCSQTHDYLMPGNSFLMHSAFNLNQNTFCFDLTLACSGYIYAIALASSLIKSGTCKNIIIVTAETYSKLIDDSDRSTKLLFGDGATASWFGLADSDSPRPILNEIVDISCGTDGHGWNKFYVEGGHSRSPLEGNRKIYMDGMGVLNLLAGKVVKNIRGIISSNGLESGDIDKFLFHQGSKVAVETLQRLLKIDKSKSKINIAELGNLVSSSLPFLLSEMHMGKEFDSGQRVLLSGFGVGFSYGSLIANA